jgi:hypothetical protein
MIRPDHAWFFFTVVLSLALAMSVPSRKAEQQKQATAYGSTIETPTQSVRVFLSLLTRTRLSVPRGSFRRWPDEQHLRGRTP